MEMHKQQVHIKIDTKDKLSLVQKCPLSPRLHSPHAAT